MSLYLHKFLIQRRTSLQLQYRNLLMYRSISVQIRPVVTCLFCELEKRDVTWWFKLFCRSLQLPVHDWLRRIEFGMVRQLVRSMFLGASHASHTKGRSSSVPRILLEPLCGLWASAELVNFLVLEKMVVMPICVLHAVLVARQVIKETRLSLTNHATC